MQIIPKSFYSAVIEIIKLRKKRNNMGFGL